MKQYLAAVSALLCLLSACAKPVDAPEPPPPGLVELRAVGMTFDGPTEIPSGWTRFRFENASPMIHFAMVDLPPPGIGLQELSDTLMDPFQAVMDAMNANDEEAVNAAFGTFPEWIGELQRRGGPGLVSPGLTAETTIYLAPGVYLLECYVKTNGVFHSTSPGEGQFGMVLPVTVTGEDNGAPEPVANVTLALRNSGMELVDGSPRRGPNTIRVDFVEQQALPSFVGNDVHLMRVDSPDSLARADDWMDWRTPEGLQSPSPVVFLGGMQDLPAGAHGYFSVDLAPGNYAFIAEMPQPDSAGMVLPFTVE